MPSLIQKLTKLVNAGHKVPSAWMQFVEEVLQGGKLEMPNPNPKTRDRHPQVSAGYILTQKDPAYQSAKADIWYKYQNWLGNQKEQKSETNQDKVDPTIRNPRDVERGDHISWVSRSGEPLTGIVERVSGSAVRVVQTSGENAGESTFIKADGLEGVQAKKLDPLPPDSDLEKPISPSKEEFKLPEDWDISNEISHKAESLYPEMIKEHGDFFISEGEKYTKDAQRMKDSLVGIDRAVWEQRSPAEKRIMFMGEEVADRFVREVLNDEERDAWSSALGDWQASSQSDGAFRLMGALTDFNIPHTIRDDTQDWKLLRWEGSQDEHLKSAVAKAMAYSQAFYDSLGVDSVHVYRGTSNALAQKSEQGVPVKVDKANPITSFSLRPSKAYEFSNAWVALKVPTSRLFMTPATWPGFASWEHEYIVPGLEGVSGKVMPKKEVVHEYDPERMKLARILRLLDSIGNNPIRNTTLRFSPMRSKKAAYQHYWTVRGSGFDEKQWRAVLRAARSIVNNAAADGIEVDATYRADVIKIAPKSVSKDSGAEPLRLYKNDGGAETYNVVCTDMEPYDPVVVSILTAAKKIAPDVIEITSDGGTDVFGRKYATRLLEGSTHRQPVHQQNSNTMLDERRKKQERDAIKKKKEDAFRQMVKRQKWRHPKTKNMVEYVTLPWEERKDIRSKWDAVYGKHFDEALRLRQQAEKYRKKTEEAAGEAQEEVEKGAEKGKKVPPALKKKTAMKTETLIRKAAIRVAAETSDKQLRRALLEILAKGLPPEFLENIKKKKDEAKSDEDKESTSKKAKNLPPEFLKNIKKKKDEAKSDEDKDAEKPWEKKKANLKAELYALFIPQARSQVNSFCRNNPSSKAASSSTSNRVRLADKLAKEWIQEAIEKPGRVREYLKKKPGEKITQAELDEAIKKVEKTDNTSLLRALQMAKTLTKMKD